MKIVGKWKTEEKFAVYVEKWIWSEFAVAVVVTKINTWIWICTLAHIYLFCDFDVFFFLYPFFLLLKITRALHIGNGVEMCPKTLFTIIQLLVVFR